MIVSPHRTNDGRIFLSICDNKLIGKKFEEDEKILDLTSEFYLGAPRKLEDTKRLLEKAFMSNFIGEESVSFGIKEGAIDKENVTYISKIPVAQMIRL